MVLTVCWKNILSLIIVKSLCFFKFLMTFLNLQLTSNLWAGLEDCCLELIYLVQLHASLPWLHWMVPPEKSMKLLLKKIKPNHIVLQIILQWTRIWRVGRPTPSCAQDHSWLCAQGFSGDHVWCWLLNPNLWIRQVPYPLYYFCSP